MESFTPDQAEALRGQMAALIGCVGALANVVARDPAARSAIEHKLRELDAQLVASTATESFVVGGRAVLGLLLYQVQP